jgi:hypothetical protein
MLSPDDIGYVVVVASFSLKIVTLTVSIFFGAIAEFVVSAVAADASC